MLIGQTDMFRTVTALGLRGRVGDQWNMCTFHQGSEKMILQLEAGYKRAVDSSAILFLQNRRGPYKRRPGAMGLKAGGKGKGETKDERTECRSPYD